MALVSSRRCGLGTWKAPTGPAAGRAMPLLPVTRPSSRRVALSAQKQQFTSFEDMLNRSDLPVLVDFYATWCGPCQMMSPILGSMASRFKGRLQVVKIDTDRFPRVASLHKVQALPTIALFQGGKIVFRFEGMMNEAQLAERVQYHLNNLAAAEEQR